MKKTTDLWGKINLTEEELDTFLYPSPPPVVTTVGPLPNASSASTVIFNSTERASINVATVTPETGVNYVNLLPDNVHYLSFIKRDKSGLFTAMVGNEAYESHDFVEVCVWLAGKVGYNLDD